MIDGGRGMPRPYANPGVSHVSEPGQFTFLNLILLWVEPVRNLSYFSPELELWDSA